MGLIFTFATRLLAKDLHKLGLGSTLANPCPVTTEKILVNAMLGLFRLFDDF